MDCEKLDGQLEEMEGIANYLRGMSLDPRIPSEFKGYVQKQVARLDKVCEAVLEIVEGC